MWLIASIIASVTGGVAGIGLGVAVAIAFDRFTDAARAFAPKTWSVLTVTTILVLALAVPSNRPAVAPRGPVPCLVGDRVLHRGFRLLPGLEAVIRLVPGP